MQSGNDALRASRTSFAEKQFLAALQEAEQFGKTDPRLSLTLRQLAELYLKEKKYEKAEALYRRDLEIIKPLGESYSEVIPILTGLAKVNEALGRYDAAKEYWKEALVSNKKGSPRDDDSQCSLLYGLGRDCRKLKQYSEAENYFNDAIKLKLVHRSGEPTLEAILNEAGENYFLAKKFEQSEDCFKKALQQALVRRAKDPGLIHAVRRLEYLYWDEGKYEDAEKMWHQGLPLAERAWRHDRPKMADYFIEQGDICAKEGKTNSAKDAFERALAIDEKALGPNDVRLAKPIKRLAETYRMLKRDKDAERLYKRYAKFIGENDKNAKDSGSTP